METTFGGQPCWLAIISASRPGNVHAMHELLGRKATWYVPPNQMDTYAAQGCQVSSDGGSLSGARNRAIETGTALGLTTLQLDDDLKAIKMAVDGKPVDSTPDEAFGDLLSRLALSDFFLGGVAPTNNAFFSKAKATSTNLFIIGSACAVKPHDPLLLFDPALPLKEDYDYTAQHITRFGGVLRCDNVLLTFQHYTNAGGAVDVRTTEREQAVIAELKRRWPGMIKDHPRRKNEVLLRAPRAQKGSL